MLRRGQKRIRHRDRCVHVVQCSGTACQGNPRSPEGSTRRAGSAEEAVPRATVANTVSSGPAHADWPAQVRCIVAGPMRAVRRTLANFWEPWPSVGACAAACDARRASAGDLEVDAKASRPPPSALDYILQRVYVQPRSDSVDILDILLSSVVFSRESRGPRGPDAAVRSSRTS